MIIETTCTKMFKNTFLYTFTLQNNPKSVDTVCKSWDNSND